MFLKNKTQNISEFCFYWLSFFSSFLQYASVKLNFYYVYLFFFFRKFIFLEIFLNPWLFL